MVSGITLLDERPYSTSKGRLFILNSHVILVRDVILTELKGSSVSLPGISSRQYSIFQWSDCDPGQNRF
jgi:hypothetical protein